MGVEVERRLIEVLNDPSFCPYGGPIPARREIGGAHDGTAWLDGVQPLTSGIPRDGEPRPVAIVRISEALQADRDVLSALAEIGAKPGALVMAQRNSEDWILRPLHSTNGEGIDSGDLSPSPVPKKLTVPTVPTEPTMPTVPKGIRLSETEARGVYIGIE